jgi:hypothetical protein
VLAEVTISILEGEFDVYPDPRSLIFRSFGHCAFVQLRIIDGPIRRTRLLGGAIALRSLFQALLLRHFNPQPVKLQHLCAMSLLLGNLKTLRSKLIQCQISAGLLRNMLLILVSSNTRVFPSDSDSFWTAVRNPV